MKVNPQLRDIADLLVLTAKEAGAFCSEVAWHADCEVTYPMIIMVLEGHPHTDPTPEEVAAWIMAGEADEAEDDPIEMEFDPTKDKLSIIQQRDFRDAQAGFKKCPHGIPITQRCRICRPTD